MQFSNQDSARLWQGTRRLVSGTTACTCLALLFSVANPVVAQPDLQIVREIQLEGVFRLLVGDELTVIDVDGKEHRVRIQEDPAKPIGLSGGNVALNQPADIQLSGSVMKSVLLPGMTVSIDCDLGLGGKTEGIRSVTLLPIGNSDTAIDVDAPPTGSDMVQATVQGFLKSINDKRMVIDVGDHELAPRGTLTFDASEFETIKFTTDSLRMLRNGDVVTNIAAADLSTGDTVVRRISVDLVDIRDDLELSVNELLTLKHIGESDEPGEPREFSTRRYYLMTDISDRQAKILLEKLESMYDLVADYYGKRPRELIEVYVVSDLLKWDTSQWEPRVVNKLRQGEGTTVYGRQGNFQKAVVFSADNHDIVQHEAVHGFCFLTFQGTGPLWYAEGMAEMGQYWKADNNAVSANPAVIGYLRSRPAHPLKSIINATQIEGEYWKAYAWRWALCHFLATNPNYAVEFRKLGVDLMRESPRASFENTWRRQANELTFEYEFFMKHLEAGLRADLIAWQWDVRTKVPNQGRALQKKILAARGWQAIGAILEEGVTYETRGDGQWKLSADAEWVDANGDSNGQGQLIGVIMKDYQLSDEFELGTDPDFVASQDGQLYVRCRERMSLIADNEGEINFAIRRKK